jgi:hypothetical protein
VRRVARWTPAEDARLRALWHVADVAALRAAFADRTWCGIARRAYRLGLRAGLPRGCWWIEDAAARTGLCRGTLRAALARARVAARAAYPSTRRGAPARRAYVEADDAVAAARAWLAREPVATAARRLGVPRSTLRSRLARTGARPAARGRHRRVSERQLAAALAGYVAVPQRRPGKAAAA